MGGTIDIKLFSDAIDALGKVVNALKGVASIPKAEREQYRQTMADTYRLIDTTLNMVVIRLGDIMLQANDQAFIVEAAQLDNCGDWLRAERELRLCRALRAALSEMERLGGRLKASASARDVDALLAQMNAATATEGEVADFISVRFRDLADSARRPSVDGAQLRQDVKAFRDALMSERQKLIADEVQMYSFL